MLEQLPVRLAFSCLLLCLAARGAAGQQFQEQFGVLPVPTTYWTEAVIPVDADEDGRWDVSERRARVSSAAPSWSIRASSSSFR